MAYVGQVAHIQLGNMGLVTDTPPSDVPRGALILANNVTFETGAITKAPGSRKHNTNALPAGIVALHDYWPNTYSQRLIALCDNGSIYQDIDDHLFGGNVAITTGLMSVTPKSFFIEGGQETALRDKKLFLFTGANQLKVLTGTESTFETIALPAADWTTPNYPTFGFLHRNRLWAFMKQRAYASTTADHEDFTSAGILTQSIYPGEGGDLIGGWIFKGRPFVFKDGGFVYYLDDSDVDSDNWNWKKLASNFGLASPHAIFETTNDMLALNESGGLISYSAINTYGGIDAADVYKILKVSEYLRNKTSLSGVDMTHTIYYEDKRQIYITGRSSFQVNNDLLIQIDMNSAQPRVSLFDKDAPNCLALRRDINKIKRPMYGAADGFVYLMDQEDRLVGASSYTGEFKTGHYDFRDLDSTLAHKNKIFDHLAVEFVPQGTWNLDIDVYIDGKFSETIQFSMDVRDDGLDTFTLDTDPLGREEAQTIQKPLHGSGRRISFHCKQAGSNQNFEITSLAIGFRVSAEQATRV
jgi:hypothetical protein